jgi:hypothetical protein
MTEFSRFLLRIARWIGGRERAEWIDAMEAEAASSGGHSTTWATGCLWAAIKDRLYRERKFILAVPLAAFGPLVLSLVLLFPMVWLWHHGWIPKWLIDHSALLEMLPFAFLLGRARPGRPAYVAAAACFAFGVMVPVMLGPRAAGESPLVWFGPYATWYMFTPAVGLSIALIVWLGGAWFGSRWKKRSPPIPTS